MTVKEILNNEWPNAEIVSMKDTDECVQRLVNANVDGALLMTYTAPKLARDDTQNRLRVEVVPGASMSLRMGVLSAVDRSFYGLWEKTLYNVSRKSRAEIVQSYVEDVGTPTIIDVYKRQGIPTRQGHGCTALQRFPFLGKYA